MTNFRSDIPTMSARSALKNKKNQKMREAIGDIAVQCGDTSEGEGVKVGHLEQPYIQCILLVLLEV